MYRAMRGIGYICQTPTVGEIRILASTWSGLRDPVAVRDGAYVFVDGNTDLSTDDMWLPVVITAVNTASTCPGGAAAYSLTISPPAAALPSVSVLTPVRIYEVEELSLYASGGQSWLGARSVSAGEVSPQPLLGPLVGTTGIALTYLDINNVATAVPANVKSIVLTVTGIANQATASYGGSSQTSVVRDTLTTQVSLRNAVRP
jgi:hypothetical protein